VVAFYVAAAAVALLASFLLARSVMQSLKIGQRTSRQVAFGDAVHACVRELRHTWGAAQINLEKYDVEDGRFAEIEAFWASHHRLSFRLDDFDYDVLVWSDGEWISGYAQFKTSLQFRQSDIEVLEEICSAFKERAGLK
jgi:hypothetical protein